jgi:hypothetical protein
MRLSCPLLGGCLSQSGVVWNVCQRRSMLRNRYHDSIIASSLSIHDDEFGEDVPSLNTINLQIYPPDSRDTQEQP